MSKINWNAIMRGALFSTLIAMAPLIVLVLVPLLNSQYVALSALPVYVAMSLVFGVVVYVCNLFTRRLQAHVGKLTGFVGLVAIIALLGTALSLVLPECPGSLTGEACTVPEGASWGLSMCLLVVLLGMIWITAVWGFKAVRKLIRWLLKRRRDSIEETEREEQEEAQQVAKREAKQRHPEEPKGYETPRREQRKKHKNKKHRKATTSTRKTDSNAS